MSYPTMMDCPTNFLLESRNKMKRKEKECTGNLFHRPIEKRRKKQIPTNVSIRVNSRGEKDQELSNPSSSFLLLYKIEELKI